MVEFLANNWFWMVLILLFVGMHSFGGGCCGAGRRREKGDVKDEANVEKEKSCH